MPAPIPLPRYVYKIVPSTPPDPLPAEYPLSELDQKDGFVHLSTAWQIPTTAGLFFADNLELWVLKIKLGRFEGATTWEVEGCPHLYGNFGAADVEAVKKFTRGSAEEKWAAVFREEAEWLE